MNFSCFVASESVLVTLSEDQFIIQPACLCIENHQIVHVELIKSDSYVQNLKVFIERYLIQKGWDDKQKIPIFDFGKNLVTPAFVNAHTHLSMSFLRGISSPIDENIIENIFFDHESRLTPEDVKVFAKMGAYESLCHGVGLVWDHYYHAHHLAQGIAEAGLCAVIAPTLQDISGPGCLLWEQQLDATLDIAQSFMWQQKGIFAAFGPHATDTVSSGLWQRIVTLSNKLKLPVHAHLAQSPEEFQKSVSQNSCSPTAWLQQIGVLEQSHSSLFAHGIYCSRQDLKILKNNNVTLIFCPFSAVNFHFPADVLEWEAMQISWIVATDCAASNDSMNLQKELRYLSGLPQVRLTYTSEYESFLANGITQNLNKVTEAIDCSKNKNKKFFDPKFLLGRVLNLPGGLHSQFVAGRFVPGALANLVVWDKDSMGFWPCVSPLRELAFAESSMSILNVMTLGKWRGEFGNFYDSVRQSPEYLDTLREAQAIFEARFLR